jgi:hypothetical protein
MSRGRLCLMLAVGLCAPEVFLSISTGHAQVEQSTQNPATPSEPARPILDWRGVETADYRAYVKNLQDIQCPAQTICDIVTADVMSAFARKRADALAARYQNSKYWKSDPSQTAARAKLASQRHDIDEEMNGVLKGLLGQDTSLPDTSREWRKMELEFELAILPAEKRRQTEIVLLNYGKVDEQINELAADIHVSEDTNELQHIVQSYKEKQTRLKQLLQPEEYKIVEMTTSPTAKNLQRAMVNFNPSESEFRIIFDAWQTQDETLVRIYSTREDRRLGDDEVYGKIKAQLTEERYKQYRDTWWN